MNVRISCIYDALDSRAWKEMHALAEGLTNDPRSVRVSGGPKPSMLTVDFTMKKKQQYEVAETIRVSLRGAGLGELDRIEFPRTELEQAQAERRQERVRERRRLRKLAAEFGELPSRPLRPKRAPAHPKPSPRVHPSRRGPEIILYVDPLTPPEV